MRRRAEARGVAGWVTNRGDGTVEAALEGRGPTSRPCSASASRARRGAEVERVDVATEPPEGLTSFKIE